MSNFDEKSVVVVVVFAGKRFYMHVYKLCSLYDIGI